MRRPDPSAARVISAHGSQAWVWDPLHHKPTVSLFKGRELKPVAGDWVHLNRDHLPPVIESIFPRDNQLLRSEGSKTKVLASNLDLAVLVVSGHPVFSPELGLRVLASLKAESIPTYIALNKSDLCAPLEAARKLLKTILPLDRASLWPVYEICANPNEQDEQGVPRIKGAEGITGLQEALHPVIGRADESTPVTIALIGQSGMGKSSLLNRLIPEAQAQTQEISTALQTGRHTTTVSRGYLWPGNTQTWIIDTPGFQRFGLRHLDAHDIGQSFPEWKAIQALRPCRFYNCRHAHEPGCAVKEAIATLTEQDLGRAQQLEQRRQAWLSLTDATTEN